MWPPATSQREVRRLSHTAAVEQILPTARMSVEADPSPARPPRAGDALAAALRDPAQGTELNCPRRLTQHKCKKQICLSFLLGAGRGPIGEVPFFKLLSL